MNRFNQLNFFHSESFLKEAARISAEKQENRDLFSEIFSTKDPGLVISIADQFYSVFRKTFGDKEEYFAAAQSLKGSQIGSVIRQIRNNKIADPKEAKLEEITKSYPQLKDPQYSDNIKALKESEVNPSHYNWIFKMLFNEEADPIEEIIKAVYFYQRNQSELERPLESFELLSELRSYFDEKLASNKEYYYSKIEKHALDPKYTDYIYQSDNFVTVLSGTTQSSQYWARGTTWCTGYLEGNQFANYSSKNIYLYYVVTKQDSELFKKSNPMRKISIGLKKIAGKPQLLTKENATVNTDNHNLSLNQIQEYLGSEADSIISAIYADLNGREDTKFNEIIAETTPEELERQIAEINDDSQVASILLQFTQNNVARADTKRVAAKNLVEKSPRDFFGYGLHKLPEYAEFGIPTAKNWAEESPYDFFRYGLGTLPEYAEFKIPAAKNLAEKNPRDFFDYDLDKLPEYAHLNPNNEAPEENKLQSLEAWLRTNGFRREAKELSTLFC